MSDGGSGTRHVAVLVDAFADPAGSLGLLTGIIAGPDGKIWIASTRTHRVGRIDPGTGGIETMADPAGRLRGAPTIGRVRLSGSGA